MPIISSVALKGGVGKTTLTHHTAGALAASGRRVLCLDNDPQASLSSGIFGPSVVESMNPAETMAALYAGLDPLPEQVIRSSGITGLDVIAGHKAAGRFNTPEPYEAPADVQLCLRAFLAEVRGDYDIVLIDNPPNLNAASWAALIASDYLVVPVVPEDYGSSSLSPVFESVSLVLTGPNPHLRMLGMVLSMVQPRLAVHQLYEATLRDQHGDDILTTRVPLAADIKEAISARKPISHYKPRGASAKVFKALADELFTRMAARNPARNQEAA
jgi:chromosome partitioning protein